MRNALVIAALATLFASCDKVADPYASEPGGGQGPGTGEGVPRRVLLEEFTGHLCNNCPAAARIAKDLQTFYGPENLIVVAIHAGDYFSEPAVPPYPDGRFSTDFRTPAGNAYANQFGVSFLPTGMVDRIPYNGSMLLSETAWGSAVADVIGQPALVDLWVSELVHEPGAGTVQAQVKIAVDRPLTSNYNLVVYLLEDRVIDWQEDLTATPPQVENYEHRHVLRDNLNGTWGQLVMGASDNVGDTISVDLSTYTMNSAWDATNCSLVAFVYDTATEQVVQATERKFYP